MWVVEHSYVKLDVTIFWPHEQGNRLPECRDSLRWRLNCSTMLHSIISIPIPLTYQP